MECAATAPAICWRFCAARAKVRPTGKVCSAISTGGAGRQAARVDRHRRLSRTGGGDSDDLSASAASALLGAQDAQYSGKSAEARLRRSENRRAGDLFGRQPRPRRGRVSPLSLALVARLRAHGAPPATRSSRTAVGVRLPPTSVAKVAHHQRHRTLLRRSAPQNSPHGLLCERRKRGPNHLLHLPEIQPGMENPHPQPIYTSSLTSPQSLMRYRIYPRRILL